MAESMGASSGWVEGLSESQEVALAALRSGGTFGKAAEAAGVNRTTVYRWVHGDPHFRAAYNAWQQEAAESARARLTKLADLAVDVVEKALRRDDEKVALKVLRGVGALRKKRRGSTDARVLDLQIQLRQKRELRRAETGMLQHFLKKIGMPAKQQRQVLAGGRGASEFREGLLKELERREPGTQGAEADDASSAEPQAEAAGEAIEPNENDNSMASENMQPEPAGPEGSVGDASSDATFEGMLHESVA